MVWNVSDHMYTPAWESRFGPALTLADYLTNRLALGRFSVLLFGNTDESLAADPMDIGQDRPYLACMATTLCYPCVSLS